MFLYLRERERERQRERGREGGKIPLIHQITLWQKASTKGYLDFSALSGDATDID